MVIDIVLGVLIGYLIVRTRIRGRVVLDALSMLPLAVPGLVMAFGFVALSLSWPFAPGDPLAGWADIIGAEPNPAPLLIAAYAVRRLPYVVRSTVAGLQQTSGELEEAARNLGASAFTAVRRVVVPLIAANLIAGGLLAFSFAMLEVSDSLILAQQEKHYPITKAIYTFADRLGDGPSIASAMGVWGMALLATTLVGASVLMGKKLGAIFRV
jgi:iron(III) transport system permease protein